MDGGGFEDVRYCSLEARARSQPVPDGQMAEYRAYIIGADGHFVRAVELLCPDDDAAKACARQLVDGHDIELWQGDRKIAKFTGPALSQRGQERDGEHDKPSHNDQ